MTTETRLLRIRQHCNRIADQTLNPHTDPKLLGEAMRQFGALLVQEINADGDLEIEPKREYARLA